MSRASIGLYEFGPFRLDLERRLFTREHQVVPLAPKTFDLLVLLVQSPGRAFSKQELMNALWPDTFVEEANLSFQIPVLRKALGEDGARWVETVPEARLSVRCGGAGDHAVRRVVGRAGQQRGERTFLGDAGARHQEGVAGRRDSHGGLARARRHSSRWSASRARRRSGLRPPCRSLRTRDTSGRRASRRDGSRVAFSWNGPTLDNYDIYVKLAGPGEPVRLTRNPAPDDWPAWSPDGRFIAFVRFASPRTAADLVVIPAHGGAERTIATIFPAPIPETSGQSPISPGRRTEDGLPSVARHHPTAREASG